MNSKQSLRRLLRQARRSLTSTQQQQAALRLRHNLLRSNWFKCSRTIALYWPADGEISPVPLLKPALRMGKSIYLPVIHHNSLVFRRYRVGDRLYKNRYGIPEPPPHRPSLRVDKLDLVLVPLVGFDDRGNRLGMGAGFYDRCFNHFGSRPWRIGLAHEIQKIEAIPQDPWDKTLHAVITDCKCYRYDRLPQQNGEAPPRLTPSGD